MGLFGRRKQVDPALEVAIAREAEPRLVRTQWPLREPLQRAVAAVDPAAAGSVYAQAQTREERSWVVGMFGGMVAEAEDLIPRWADAGTDGSLFGLLGEAYAYNRIGWRARGARTADTVSGQSADVFAVSLQHGYERCMQAWRATGERDITPLAAAQEMLISTDSETVWAHAQSWMRTDQWSVLGWRSLVDQLDARWHGTDQSQLELVHRVATGAPDGDPVLAVVPQLLFKRWTYLLYFGDMTYSQAHAEFWMLSPIQELLHTAYRKLFETGAYRPGPFEIETRNFFAFALYQSGFDVEAHREMRALQGRVTFEPWDTRQEGKGLADFAESREHVIKIVDFGMPLHDGRR